MQGIDALFPLCGQWFSLENTSGKGFGYPGTNLTRNILNWVCSCPDESAKPSNDAYSVVLGYALEIMPEQADIVLKVISMSSCISHLYCSVRKNHLRLCIGGYLYLKDQSVLLISPTTDDFSQR